MARFVAVWTLRRGKLDPPEPLDEQGQRLANRQNEIESTRSRRVPRSNYRAEAERFRERVEWMTREACA